MREELQKVRAFFSLCYETVVISLHRRIGLETDSEEALFVLRNVVLSPFQAAGNFVKSTIGNIFQQVLEEQTAVSDSAARDISGSTDSLQHVIARNTIRPQRHEFVMQGIEELYLVYRQHFHRADARQQIILSATITNPNWWKTYQTSKRNNSTDVWILETSSEELLSDVLQPSSDVKFTMRGMCVLISSSPNDGLQEA